jgi:hypothetical protein
LQLLHALLGDTPIQDTKGDALAFKFNGERCHDLLRRIFYSPQEGVVLRNQLDGFASEVKAYVVRNKASELKSVRVFLFAPSH